MAQGTRPICAWCGNEAQYGFEIVSYWGQIFQYTVGGALVFLHPRCEGNYRIKQINDAIPLPTPYQRGPK
jgi:hypothetical protein